MFFHSKSILDRTSSAVGNESDYRSRGREFDPGSVPYFHGV